MTDSSADSSSVRFWRWVAVIAALGLAARIGYILGFSSHLNFGLDSVWYQLEGGALGQAFAFTYWALSGLSSAVSTFSRFFNAFSTTSV